MGYLTFRIFSSPQWGSKAFKNLRIIPPGSGIVHQVNLEYLARVVFNHDGFYYPDSLVGTDSHTTMIDGLGVLGWGKAGSFDHVTFKNFICDELLFFANSQFSCLYYLHCLHFTF